MTPQQKSVLKYMQTRRSITGMQALNKLGVARLPARIAELKFHHKIDSKMVKVKNRHGEFVHVKKYWLV